MKPQNIMNNPKDENLKEIKELCNKKKALFKKAQWELLLSNHSYLVMFL